MDEKDDLEKLPDIAYYRMMEAHDASAVGNLVTHVFCEAVITHFDAEGIADMLRTFSPENFAWRLHNGYWVLIAELDHQIVGMIEMREDGHITLLFVDSACQGRGIGHKLLELALRNVMADNPGQREVTVHATPNAVGFYEKEGFLAINVEQHERGMRFLPMALQVEDFHSKTKDK